MAATPTELRTMAQLRLAISQLLTLEDLLLAEMRIDSPHFVQVSLGDSLEKVGNVGADSPDSS